MKRILMIGLMVLCGIGLMVAQADVAPTVSVVITNGGLTTVTSAVVNASGYIDKIEVTQTVSTNVSAVTIATFANNAAVETFANLAAFNSASKVIRPRFLPTDNTGTALAAATNGSTGMVTTALNINYERPYVGGNVYMVVTPTAIVAGQTNIIRATVYYSKTPQLVF